MFFLNYGSGTTVTNHGNSYGQNSFQSGISQNDRQSTLTENQHRSEPSSDLNHRYRIASTFDRITSIPHRSEPSFGHISHHPLASTFGSQNRNNTRITSIPHPSTSTGIDPRHHPTSSRNNNARITSIPHPSTSTFGSQIDRTTHRVTDDAEFDDCFTDFVDDCFGAFDDSDCELSQEINFTDMLNELSYTVNFPLFKLNFQQLKGNATAIHYFKLNPNIPRQRQEEWYQIWQRAEMVEFGKQKNIFVQFLRQNKERFGKFNSRKTVSAFRKQRKLASVSTNNLRLFVIALDTKERKKRQEMTYQCGYEGCGYASNAKYCMQRHQSVHNGIKRYSCSVCKQPFSTIDSLCRHKSRMVCQTATNNP